MVEIWITFYDTSESKMTFKNHNQLDQFLHDNQDNILQWDYIFNNGTVNS